MDLLLGLPPRRSRTIKAKEASPVLKSKIFWYNLMAGALLLWPAVIILGYFFEKPLWGWGVFIALIILHASEIKKGMQVGSSRGISKTKSAVKTFIFGFTWWVPLGKNIIDN